MAGMLRVPRSRGALSGVLLVLLGVWGGIIPFVGPYFQFAYSPATSWTYTSGRLWLEILPAAGTVLGGLIVLFSGVRPVAMFGAWLAAVSGAWFAVGVLFAPLWTARGALLAGVPVASSTVIRVLEQISFFTGLGVVIVFFAALSLGRFSVIGIREARFAEREVAAPDSEVLDSEVPDSGVPAGERTEPVLQRHPPTSAVTRDGDPADQ